MSAPARNGSISDCPVPRLVLELHASRFSGDLTLLRGAVDKHIQFLEGAPVQARSSVASEGLCAQLVAAGSLGRKDGEQATDLARARDCPEGSALLALKLMDAKPLFAALKDHLRRQLVEATSWAEGEWELDAQANLPDNARAFRTDPVALMRDGIAEHWGVERIAADLAPNLSRFPSRTRRYNRVASRLDGDPAVARFCASLDGDTTLARALGADAANPVVLASAWVLEATQSVDWLEAAATSGAEEMPDIEIEVAQRPESGRTAAGSAESGAAGAGVAGAGAGGEDPAITTLREEIADRFQRLGELDHYQVLGVDNDAGTAAIKKAYFSAAKRYHPDALNRLGLSELKSDAGEVFSAISEAYEALSRSDRRAHYDEVLAGGGEEIDVERLAQAETNFRKGEIMVRMGDFRGALEFLKPAVDLWPQEGAYQSALGWAYHKKSPPELELALEHLELAVELSPEDPVTHFRFGTVLRASGDSARAAEHLARAKQMDPSVG